jgi:hypothetical protein
MGFATFNLSPGTNLLSDPFVDISDTNYDNASTGFAPVNTVGTLFCGTTSSMPGETIATGYVAQRLVTETNTGSGNWTINSDIPMRPGDAALFFNPSGTNAQTLIGLLRPVATNQIHAGINYLGSARPISGGITSVLGMPTLSSNDTVVTWSYSSGSFVTNTWKGTDWVPSEPIIGLCQGFILNCSTSHLWIQTNFP